MNLLTFIWKTAPMLFVANGILIAGVITSLLMDALPSAIVALVFLVVVDTASAVGSMNHMKRLTQEKFTLYIHNLCVWHRQGNPLPSTAEAMQDCDRMKSDPLA